MDQQTIVGLAAGYVAILVAGGVLAFLNVVLATAFIHAALADLPPIRNRVTRATNHAAMLGFGATFELSGEGELLSVFLSQHTVGLIMLSSILVWLALVGWLWVRISGVKFRGGTNSNTSTASRRGLLEGLEGETMETPHHSIPPPSDTCLLAADALEVLPRDQNLMSRDN